MWRFLKLFSRKKKTCRKLDVEYIIIDYKVKFHKADKAKKKTK